MVGAAGIVASTINNRHQRRESRSSQHGGDDHHRGSSRYPAGRFSHCPPPPHTISSSLPFRDGPPSYTYPRTSTQTVTQTPGDEIIPEKLSLAEQVKFYVSLTLGIIASLCVFALLFLIPLVVEPSISTLLADFDPRPATCVTVDSTTATGLSKCGLWSSCREGCTSTPSQCHQIYVSYRRPDSKHWPKLRNFSIIDPHEWLDESRWDVSYTQLLINAKGCGYPPRVKCDEFGDTYGLQGRTFPCYYSRANPRLVVTDYNWEEAANPLLLSLCLPTGLFGVSIAVLSFWYCPCCEERGKNKRPCRARYQSAPKDDRERDSSQRRNNRPQPQSQQQVPPIIQQQPRPNNKPNGGGLQQQRSPSLATISSRDTTISSVNSMDDGWQSPPTPPPRQPHPLRPSQQTRKL